MADISQDENYCKIVDKNNKTLIIGSGLSNAYNNKDGCKYLFNAFYQISKHKDIFISDIYFNNDCLKYNFINNVFYNKIFETFTLKNIENIFPKTYLKYKNKKITYKFYESILKEKFIKIDLCNDNNIIKLSKYDSIHIRYVLHLKELKKVNRINIINQLYNKLNKGGKIYIQNYTKSKSFFHHNLFDNDIIILKNMYIIEEFVFFDEFNNENKTIIITKNE